MEAELSDYQAENTFFAYPGVILLNTILTSCLRQLSKVCSQCSEKAPSVILTASFGGHGAYYFYLEAASKKLQPVIELFAIAHMKKWVSLLKFLIAMKDPSEPLNRAYRLT